MKNDINDWSLFSAMKRKRYEELPKLNDTSLRFKKKDITVTYDFISNILTVNDKEFIVRTIKELKQII